MKLEKLGWSSVPPVLRYDDLKDCIGALESATHLRFCSISRQSAELSFQQSTVPIRKEILLPQALNLGDLI